MGCKVPFNLIPFRVWVLSCSLQLCTLWPLCPPGVGLPSCRGGAQPPVTAWHCPQLALIPCITEDTWFGSAVHGDHASPPTSPHPNIRVSLMVTCGLWDIAVLRSGGIKAAAPSQPRSCCAFPRSAQCCCSTKGYFKVPDAAAVVVQGLREGRAFQECPPAQELRAAAVLLLVLQRKASL